jgi:hypothetical protein
VLCLRCRYFDEWFDFSRLNCPSIQFGDSLSRAFTSQHALYTAVQLFGGQRYLLAINESAEKPHGAISIIVHKYAEKEDKLKALFHAALLAMSVRELRIAQGFVSPHVPSLEEGARPIDASATPFAPMCPESPEPWLQALIASTYTVSERYFSAFHEALIASGWQTDALIVVDRGFRAEWFPDEFPNAATQQPQETQRGTQAQP